MCGCHSNLFFNQPLIFEWCVVRSRSKNKHHEDMCFKKIGLYLQILLNPLHKKGNVTMWTVRGEWWHVSNEHDKQHEYRGTWIL